MDAIQGVIRQPAFAFRAMNLAVGGLLITDSVGHLILHSFSDIIIGIYGILFGALLIALEVYTPPPNYVLTLYRYASFLFSFVGRGVSYILVGSLVLNHDTWVWVLGVLIGLVGLAFVAMEFAKVVELPPSMVPPGHDPESQPVWSAEAEG